MIESACCELIFFIVTKFYYVMNNIYFCYNILYNMVYQMGVKGVLNFKNMIKALEAKDYKRAGDEMLDSKWAKQTPARANRLSKAMKAI